MNRKNAKTQTVFAIVGKHCEHYFKDYQNAKFETTVSATKIP